MLFLELALIRWLGANIVHLGYFSNFVLLGSLPRRRARLPARAARPAGAPLYFPVVLAPLVVLVLLVPGHRRARRQTTSSTSPRCAPPGRRRGSRCPLVFLGGRRRHGRPRRARRALLPAAGAARGLPLRPARQPRRHRARSRRSRSCGRRRWPGVRSWPSLTGRAARAARRAGPGSSCRARLPGSSWSALLARRVADRRASPGRRTTRSTTEERTADGVPRDRTSA